MRNLFRLWLALVTVTGLIGCGAGGSGFVGPGPSPGTPVPPIGRLATYLVASNFAAQSLDVFTVDSVTGALSAVAGSPTVVGSRLYSLANPPGQNFFYAIGNDDGSIRGYRMNANGGLTTLPGLPVQGLREGTLTTDSDGEFLYCPGESSIDAFRINIGDGTLTHLSGFPLEVPGMVNATLGVVDPLDRFLLVADPGSNRIYRFLHNRINGSLTALGQTATAAPPEGLRLDPTGRFLYVSESDGNLEGFSLESDGSLTALSGFPVRYAGAGSLAFHMAFAGSNLFVGDSTSGTMVAFRLGSGGQLTALTGYPVAGGASVSAYPLPLTSFLYTCDLAQGNIYGYRLSDGGQVTAITGSPFRGSGSPTQLLPMVISF